MAEKKTKKKKVNIKTYACDFETNTEAWLHNEAWKKHLDEGVQAWVWSWGASEIKEDMNFKGELDNFIYGKSIKEYVDWMLSGSKNIWFHNLKFDGSFIAVELLNRGYEFTFDKNPAKGQFTGLIDGKKMWFNLKVCSEGVRGGRVFVEIKDSLKKVPFGLRACATAFGLDVFKDELDYDMVREPYEPISPADYKYLKKDVEITAKIIHFQVFQSGLKKTTIGSDALFEFKKTLGNSSKEYNAEWERLFPVLNYETDEFIRKSYFGGITQVKPGMEGKVVGEGCVFDINSMYPYVQRHKELPYGMPIKYEGEYEYDEEYPLYIQRVQFSFRVKENWLPVIQLKKRNVDFNYADEDDERKFNPREFQKTSDGEIVTMYLTSVQWEQIKRHYDLDYVEFIDGYKFQSKVGVFEKHIAKWLEVKIKASNEGNDSAKSLSKLMLNSPYGKFGTGTDKVNVGVNLGKDGELRFVTEDEEETKNMTPEEYRQYEIENATSPVYTAYASFVTAHARNILTETIMKVYHRFLYCDTDSIHIQGTETPEELKDVIHRDKLGFWDKEGEFEKAKFIRAKTYCEMLYAKEIEIVDRWGDTVTIKKHCSKEEATTTDKNLKCAGMQAQLKDLVEFDEFEIGLKIDPKDPVKEKWRGQGKLMPSQVKGGTLLKIRKFSLN